MPTHHLPNLPSPRFAGRVSPGICALEAHTQRYVVRVNARRTQRVEVIPLFHPRSRATAKPTSPDPDPAPAQRSELPD